MNDILASILERGSTLTVQDIFMQIIFSAIIGVVIYISYRYTHTGTSYSKKFNISLVTLTILTTTVMTVIGNNVALSLGMVGALSIVRFRTAIKDSRDTTYIFWTIIVGICCGVGDYVVASVGSLIVFVVLLLFGRVRNDNRILFIIRGSLDNERAIEGIVFEYFNGRALLRVKNTTPESIEMIFELSKRAYDLSYKKDIGITDAIYKLGNIEYVNIVTQSDEISG